MPEAATDLQASADAAKVTGETELDSSSRSGKISKQKLDMTWTGLHFPEIGKNLWLKLPELGDELETKTGKDILFWMLQAVEKNPQYLI